MCLCVPVQGPRRAMRVDSMSTDLGVGVGVDFYPIALASL
jgi:hypothetical protein